jgi:hypothetical protein
MTSRRRLAALAVCACLGWSNRAAADVVTDWNLIMTQILFPPAPAAPLRPGPTAILDSTMVHIAMHDAIQAFEERFETYAPPIPNASGSPIAAAAAAAHGVLVARFPSKQADLDARLFEYLNLRGLLGDAGIAVGQEAAVRIVTVRAGDGSFPSSSENFTGGTAPGDWRPTPPAFASMATPWLANVVPFTLKDSTQLQASPPPPHLGSGEYVNDYNEVKALGSAGSTARTQAQSDLALFYADNFFLLWQRTLRAVAEQNIGDIGGSARVLALANMAAADATITAWVDKRYWNFWRPITAIREGENDGNPRTAGDPAWTPYLTTPPYPDYTSGANNLTGSMTRTLELFFGDKLTFSVFSATANVTKTYHRFSEMADDVVDVRIYQGIHFRAADVVARRQGTRAADWAFSHVLRP